MFSNTLSFLSSRRVNDQVSHLYKTTGKIKQLLEEFKKKKIYRKLKHEALDRTLWGTCFGRGRRPVERETRE